MSKSKAVTIYGIKNCDTMKKARAWLDSHGIAYAFHDYKSAGIERAMLDNWAREIGWETLLNRAGTTFRALPEKAKNGLDEKKAVALMVAQPSMIKRPVLDVGGELLVGFKPEPYAKAFGVQPLTAPQQLMREYRIAAIPGDGIGAEVIAAGVKVLALCAERDGGFRLIFDHFEWGSNYYKRHGVVMPADGLERIRQHDAIYFGAVGATDVPDHVTLWGLRLAICQPFDQYANVRPTRLLPGIISPLRHVRGEELDWVIVRENSEGEYSGIGGRVHRGLPEEVATDVAVFTRAGVARIMRFAFALARSRPRKLLTVVTKSNAQRHGMVMWDEIAAEIAAEFADVTWDKMLVDAMTMRMVLHPQTLDTIVATNLHADILSDLAAALAGSLGIAPTANLNPERLFPSMFEPIHGSAFDIAGKGIANPVASFWSGSMMLQHLGEAVAASRLMRAIERVTADRSLHTPDLGGTATTAQVTDAVCAALLGDNR